MAPGISAVIRLSRQIVIVVDMAIRASVYLARWRHLVRIGQREARRAVVKIRRQPGDRIVTSGARRNRKHRGRRRMFGVRRLLPRCKMASRVPAVGGGNLQIVVAACVTARTGNISVPVGERKVDRRSGVVEARSVERPA